MTTRANQQLPATVRDALVWLQEQMTQVRDQMARMQQETDESLGRLGGLQERVDELYESVGHATRQASAVTGLQAEVAEAREIASQLRERLTATDLRQQEAARQREADSERERGARTELARRMDDMTLTATDIDQRMNSLETAQQQHREAAIALRREADELRSATTGLQSRETALSEMIRRLETSLTAIETRTGDSERASETLSEHLHLAIEQSRRVEQRIETDVMERLAAIDGLGEQIDVLRAERTRWDARLQTMEVRLDRVDEAVAEQVSLTTKLHGRLQGIDARIVQLQADLTGLGETVVAQFVRFGQTLERQRRRQVGDLEREIRELRQHATRLSEE